MAGNERIILCGGTPAPSRAKQDDLLVLDLNDPNPNVNLKIDNIQQTGVGPHSRRACRSHGNRHLRVQRGSSGHSRGRRRCRVRSELETET